MLSGVFSHEVLKTQFAGYRSINDKISYEIANGALVNLRKGWYTTKESLEKELYLHFNAANLIYGPSYISLYTALEYWQLIPEAVKIIESGTLKRSLTIKSPIGIFNYRNVPDQVFSIGLKSVKTDKLSFVIADQAKALCDVIWTTPGIILRSRKDVFKFLTEDLRIDEEDFSQFDVDTLEQCLSYGKKKELLRHLIKIVKNAG